MENKAIEKARRTCEKIAYEHEVPVSSVVWAGNNKFVVVKCGVEYRIEAA